MLLGVLVLCACSTAAQRRAGQNAEIEKEAAKQMRRICALPVSAREAEIKRLEDESGVTVNCGKD
jgi:hypothetical protein